MRAISSVHARHLIDCWRNVGLERRQHPESYPSGIGEVAARGKDKVVFSAMMALYDCMVRVNS